MREAAATLIPGSVSARDGVNRNRSVSQSARVLPIVLIARLSCGVVFGQAVSQIDVVDVKDTNSLSKHGMNYYDYNTGVTPSANPDLQQGATESANFQSAESAVRLVSVMRQFEMLQRAVTIGGDMSRRAIEQVAKVTA